MNRGRRLAAFAMALALLACIPASARDAYRRDFDEYFRKYSKRYFGVGHDWRLFKAQAIAESNLKSDARSWARAKGVMQLMPETYAELRRKNPEFGNIDEPRWNIAAGILYDSQLWRRFDDLDDSAERRRFMFAAYNAGPTTIRRARSTARESGHDQDRWDSIVAVAPKVPSWRHRETIGYIRRIDLVHRDLTH